MDVLRDLEGRLNDDRRDETGDAIRLVAFVAAEDVEKYDTAAEVTDADLT